MFKSVKTFVLLAALSGLLLLAGQLIGQEGGLVVALFIALALNVGSYWFSDKIAIKMARARPANPAEVAWYPAMVQQLSQAAGQPMPKLYISPSPQPNAFATGRNPRNAAVCLNQGLIDLLDRDEMEGVLAHELSHVYNRDILIGTIAATIATAITFLARFTFFFGGGRDREGGALGHLLLVFLAPVAAMVIRLAVTRSRETQADASGAHMTGKPLALASALMKLDASGRDPRRMRLGGTPAETSPAFSQLYISAPFGGAVSRGMGKMFRTHPTTAQRVRNLEQIARELGQIA